MTRTKQSLTEKLGSLLRNWQKRRDVLTPPEWRIRWRVLFIVPIAVQRCITTDFSELTTPMINEFIDKILVHAPYYIDGERMQEVEIYLNFIGKFEIPQPQLSEKEIKRQKQLKQPV